MATTLAQQLKDPALRSKLKDSQLTPALRAMRIRNRLKKSSAEGALDVYDPLKPLSGNPLRVMTEALLDLKTKPQLTALDRQAGQTNAQYAQTIQGAHDYDAVLAKERQAALDATKTADQTWQGAHDKSVTGMNDALGAVRQQLAGEQSHAAALGQGSYGQEDAMQRLYQSAAGANDRAQASGGHLADLSRADEVLAASRLGSGAMRASETDRDLRNRQAQALGDIATKRQDVVQGRDADRLNILNELRKQQFDNQATMQGLNIKAADIQSGAQQAAANQAIALKRLGLDQKRLEATITSNALDRAVRKDANDVAWYRALHPSKGSDKTPGGLTPAQVDSRRQKAIDSMDKIRSATALIKRLQTTPIDGKTLDRNSIKAYLASKGVEDFVIQAAFDYTHGKFNPGTVKLLKARHIPVPKALRN